MIMKKGGSGAGKNSGGGTSGIDLVGMAGSLLKGKKGGSKKNKQQSPELGRTATPKKKEARKTSASPKGGGATVGHKSRAQLTKTQRLAKKRRTRGGGRTRRS